MIDVDGIEFKNYILKLIDLYQVKEYSDKINEIWNVFESEDFFMD